MSSGESLNCLKESWKSAKALTFLSLVAYFFFTFSLRVRSGACSACLPFLPSVHVYTFKWLPFLRDKKNIQMRR